MVGLDCQPSIKVYPSVFASHIGLLTEELKAFLETNLPKKKAKVQLGVSDSKLGAAINEALSIGVTHVGVVPEVGFIQQFKG